MPPVSTSDSTNNTVPVYDEANYKWARYLPVEDDFKTGDLEDYDYVEPATRVDPTKPLSFLDEATSALDIVPAIGTEIKGVQISKLTPAQLDEMSLLLAKRALLVFRDQDFCNLTTERQREIVR